jgi:FkbM family methyltransferase
MHKGYWFYGRRREHESMSLFSRLVSPGDRVIEIGGHIGYITLYFACLAGEHGKVIVFEPGPNNLPYIRANVGGRKNVTLIQSAVADFSGKASFYIENYTGQNNSLLSDYLELDANLDAAGLRSRVVRSKVEVDCIRLDDFLKDDPAPSFIKIDVEGAELMVLKGMSQTLRAANLALMVEVTSRAPEVFELLTAAGFKAFAGYGRPIRDVRELRYNTFWLKDSDPRMQLLMR